MDLCDVPQTRTEYVTNDEKPLVVQSDFTILLDVHSPVFREARDKLMRFAELVKSPEHMHVYRITPLSLWNAASAGATPAWIMETLSSLSRYSVPPNLATEIEEKTSRFGLLKLVRHDDTLLLAARDDEILKEVLALGGVRDYVLHRNGGSSCAVDPGRRGQLKLALIKAGYPVEDLAGYRVGRALPIALRATAAGGQPFEVRPYQRESVDAFHAGGSVHGGSGVVVLPCGAGKTIVGMAVMAEVGMSTLILSTSVTALRQWRRELVDKTTLTDDQIGEYSGEVKEVKPVTLSTYQIMTYRRSKTDAFSHLDVFSKGDWGLVVYDEVHLLPAPVFRFTAEIQATRRLGLTATLIREDGREDEVFSLIGPKKYDIPWRVLEQRGWIANARCVEIRAELEPALRPRYFSAGAREKFRLASENPRKQDLVLKLVERHAGDLVLIIGQYLEQLERLKQTLGCPLITGRTPHKTREDLYARFRRGELRTLIVSKVGNFAIDLPDANVAIQVSGTFGSRQEEAQRLGRILRPKAEGVEARFYSIVTRQSRDQEFAEKRQLFLTEQGYEYEIHDARKYEE
jgi:DNA excision repair protein ERCC-3